MLAKAEGRDAYASAAAWLARSLLIVDEIGYLPVTPAAAILVFQLVNARYEKGSR